ITNFDLSHPGPISPTITLSMDDFHNPNGDGTCTYSLVPANNPVQFSGNWDGTKATLSTSMPDPDVPSFTMTINASFNAVGLTNTPPPVFPMTVVSSITPTTTTVTATIQPRPADAGITVNIFVFAYVPQSLLGPKSL